MRLLKSAAVLATASLFLFGCADSGDDSGAGSLAEPEAADLLEGQEEEAADGAANPQFDTGERAIVYEATLRIEDPDPDGTAEEAWDLAESYGGFVTADERDRETGEEASYSSAHLVLRVPSERFTEAMDAFSALGETERRRAVTTEDVTEATVDLESYIATKSASVERVRGLLAEATSVTAILELEAELAEREGELASLEAQLEDLQDRVALSTIDFTVVVPSAPEEAGAYGGPDSFWDGVVVGFKGVVGLLVAVSVVIGVVLPFLPVAALVAAAIVVPIRLARKRSLARMADTEPPAAPPVPAEAAER
jgi:hypothetical protein